MQFLKKLFSNPLFDSELIGVWEIDMENSEIIYDYGNVQMTFKKNGQLTYDILLKNRIQRMNLFYWTIGGIIYSNQASAPLQAMTKYHFENDTLVLEFEGRKSRYHRQVRPACKI
jgi:hypothetical protein